MDFKTILEHGWPSVVLAAVGFWIWRAGWPFLRNQLESAQRHNRELSAQFLEALERREKAFADITETNREIVRELKLFGDQLRRIEERGTKR